MIDQLVEDVAAQNSTKSKFVPVSRHSSRSASNLDEEGSSNSGSNDNLGVWDDVSSDSDSDVEGEGGREGAIRTIEMHKLSYRFAYMCSYTLTSAVHMYVRSCTYVRTQQSQVENEHYSTVRGLITSLVRILY